MLSILSQPISKANLSAIKVYPPNSSTVHDHGTSFFLKYRCTETTGGITVKFILTLASSLLLFFYFCESKYDMCATTATAMMLANFMSMS